ncbi:MAG: DUF58 domain-containing protein [Streptosporangiaceae bacterium]
MLTRSPKLALYAVFAGTSFLTALVLGRPELAALGAPFALVLVVGLALPPPPQVTAFLRLARQRAIEGEEIDADLVVSARPGAHELQLVLVLPDGIRAAGSAGSLLLRLPPRGERTFPVRLVCARWGAYRVGTVLLRSGDLAGLRVLDTRVNGNAPVRVYPRPPQLQALVPPAETQPFAGNRVAREKGEGIEFADIRPYLPGDRRRRINWRVSAARQTLYVSQQHPERNSDVVIFLDSFAEARGQEEGTLDLAIRAAASLADHYLATRDRVGLVGFGGVVRWLTPATGTTQLYRIVDALLETEIVFSFVWKGIDVLPARSLTPQALVIALSPLLDDRSVGALLDLRGRGFDLVVVDVSPLAFTTLPRDPDSRMALRMWRLWRDALHFRFERLGVAVVEWDGRGPLAEVIEEVRAFRRFARFTSA